MSEWVPLVYRSDSAWIGVMPDGQIGSGVEGEGRASLKQSNFIAMWPFMERDLSECLDRFTKVWAQFGGVDVPTPQKLAELTVETAWGSGRQYWMRCAAGWVLQMAERMDFEPHDVRRTAGQMLRSQVLATELRRELRRVVQRDEGGGGDPSWNGPRGAVEELE
ncbi:hypothetical protein OG474_36765 [Kribbella sp. NBC_01505]|uniref:hypothetical protein n=1 Tax=Kribbella sp. NBC_01505 TaxID=2903580 RepID=UPI0038676FCD